MAVSSLGVVSSLGGAHPRGVSSSPTQVQVQVQVQRRCPLRYADTHTHAFAATNPDATLMTPLLSFRGTADPQRHLDLVASMF